MHFRFHLLICGQLIRLGDIFLKQGIRYRIAQKDLFIAIFFYVAKTAFSSIPCVIYVIKVHQMTTSHKNVVAYRI